MLDESDFYDELYLEFTIEMDGYTHDCPTHVTGCCKHHGKLCVNEFCGGWMHYQPVYGGYYYLCEQCNTTSI